MGYNPHQNCEGKNENEGVHLLTNTELMESVCNENNLDLEHLKGNPVR